MEDLKLKECKKKKKKITDPDITNYVTYVWTPNLHLPIWVMIKACSPLDL